MVEKERTKVSNEQKLGASYISDFFTEIRNLTDQYALYKNLLIEIDGKRKGVSEPQFEDVEKENLKVAVQNVRFYCHKVMIHYRTLTDTIKVPDELNAKILKLYGEINAEFLPSTESIEFFVIEINKLLVRDVIRSLLENSADILSSLYQK